MLLFRKMLKILKKPPVPPPPPIEVLFYQSVQDNAILQTAVNQLKNKCYENTSELDRLTTTSKSKDKELRQTKKWLDQTRNALTQLQREVKLRKKQDELEDKIGGRTQKVMEKYNLLTPANQARRKSQMRSTKPKITPAATQTSKRTPRQNVIQVNFEILILFLCIFFILFNIEYNFFYFN